MNKKLKIGIDFHGVIDSNFEFFKSFSELALSHGHEIYVITGGEAQKIEVSLQTHYVKFSHIYSLYDYFKEKNMLEILEDGRFWVAQEYWNPHKAEYCLEKGIDIHIDDNVEYLRDFKTTSCLYDKIKTECVCSNHIKIDFSQSPEKFLDEIEKYCLFNN
ncbi:MAG: hypothetical protein ACK5N8_07355 [Alphaproteobacteria bacterium]